MGAGVAVGDNVGVSVGAVVGDRVEVMVGVRAEVAVREEAGVAVGDGTRVKVDAGRGVASETVGEIVSSRATSWTQPASTRNSAADPKLTHTRTRFNR